MSKAHKNFNVICLHDSCAAFNTAYQEFGIFSPYLTQGFASVKYCAGYIDRPMTYLHPSFLPSNN